jgi:hypothetical protein
VAGAGRQAKALAGGVAALTPGASVDAFSVAGYLAAEDPPSRVVLCPPGRSVAADLEFLSRAARRLLWPAPAPRLQQAIGGLRNSEDPERGSRGRARRAAASGSGVAALLLEGEVDLARARAALAASGPRLWIVETPGRVRLSDRHLDAFERAGVRWSALEPVGVVALYAMPALARAASSWRNLLPPRTPVWIRSR